MGKCSLFKRHQWGWAKNVRIVRMGPRTGSITLRGLYRCDCGAEKQGAPVITTTPQQIQESPHA